MSWTSTSHSVWGIGAIAFKPVAFQIEQEGFAFGDDDGNESAHTLDTQDTNVTEALGTKTLRVLLNATGTPTSTAYKLKYQNRPGLCNLDYYFLIPHCM